MMLCDFSCRRPAVIAAQPLSPFVDLARRDA